MSETKKIRVGNTNSKVTEAIPGFDWNECLSYSSKLIENKKIKKHPNDHSKVFCHAPYAQDLYEMYSGKSMDFQEPVEGSVVNGTVLEINNRYALIDVNWREDAMLDLSKENQDYLKYIQKGFPIEVIIEKTSSNREKESVIYASYSKNIQAKKKEEILSSIGEPIAFMATVKELIHGGYFLDIDGITCFMPGSLGGMNKLVDFESLLGKQIYVMAINYSKDKDYIVVSHREYLKTLVPIEISKLEYTKLYDGFVTGCSKHGIFVEFNSCLTGLITKSEISSELINDFEERKIKAGDAISFYVSEIVDNDKIVLSMNEPKPIVSAWDDIEERYKIPSSVTGKVRKIVKYGVFIELEPKVVGLLHKSQLEENSDFQVGQEIEVKIVKIDKESKKVDFTM
jgi:small subunit ribosomal protein S1